MNNKFINRSKEFDSLKVISKKKTTETSGRIVMFFSKAGIGKARLIDEFVSQHYPLSLRLKVRRPASVNAVPEPYAYFNELYEKFIEYAGSCPKYHFVPSIGINYKALSLGVTVEKSEDIPNNIVAKYKHVRKFLLKYSNDIIISVENAQVIDFESINIICTLLKEFNNIFIFFEYTIDDFHNSNHLYGIFESLQEFSIENHPIEVKKMDFDHIFEIISELKGTKVNKNQLQTLYLKYDGNIDQLLLCCPTSNHDILGVVENNRIPEALSADAKFMLYLVLFYRGIVYKDELLRILKQNANSLWNEQRFNLACEELKVFYYLYDEEHRLFLNNSIIETLEQTPFPEEAYIASIIIENICYDRLNKEKTEIESLYRLLYMYFLFNSDKVFSLFPYIKQRLTNTQSVVQVLEQIKKITNNQSIHRGLKEKLILKTVDILYDLGEMTLAKESLDDIFQENNLQHEMYNLALKASLNDCEFALYYESLKQKYKNLKRVVLFCEYIHLYYKMKFSTARDAKEYAESLLDNAEFKNYLEYNFILKNYSTYINNDAAIDVLQQCISAFERFGRKDLVIRTSVTLAMRYANKGDLAKAYTVLHTAHKKNAYECREYYFLNNKAVISILSGDFTEAVELNLKACLALMPSHYERGIILCNLLIYYCNTNNYAKASDVANQLEDAQYFCYSFEQYKHILHYNLYYYYSMIGNNECKEYHLKALQALSENCPLELQEYMNATVFGGAELPPNHRRYFYSQFSYRPDYIGYWQLEVPDLSKYYSKHF